jgi:NAD(P)-dependent dehydrogenase (short-subunit alcohol dehydrogenase family)
MCVTKAGVKMFTKCLRWSWRAGRYRNAIARADGYPMIQRIPTTEAPSKRPTEWRWRRPGGVQAGHPDGSAEYPEDQAAAVLFLASEAAAQITGHILYVDGMAKLV